MKYALILAIIFTKFALSAELDKPYFTTKSGQRIELPIALAKSLQGEDVYKCQVVKAKVSKSGTSISMSRPTKKKAE